MAQPQDRNEFGLDEKNAVDVQKERANSWMPWVAGIVGVIALFLLMMFVLPSMRNNDGTHVPPAAPKTQPGTLSPQR